MLKAPDRDRIGLVTSSGRSEAERVLRAAQIYDAFDGMVFDEDVGSHKLLLAPYPLDGQKLGIATELYLRAKIQDLRAQGERRRGQPLSRRCVARYDSLADLEQNECAPDGERWMGGSDGAVRSDRQSCSRGFCLRRRRLCLVCQVRSQFAGEVLLRNRRISRSSCTFVSSVRSPGT